LKEKKFDGVDKQQVDNAHNGHDERGPAKKESTTPPDFHRMMMVPDRILVKFIFILLLSILGSGT
jgi:hypothetical protein